MDEQLGHCSFWTGSSSTKVDRQVPNGSVVPILHREVERVFHGYKVIIVMGVAVVKWRGRASPGEGTRTTLESFLPEPRFC